MNILDLNGKEKGKIDLPEQFKEPIRLDLIHRAAEVVESNSFQQHGTKKGAGMRHHAIISKRRKDYKGSYGHGISRIPRKILSKNGTRFNWVGANVAGAVGGRRAHPPKTEKILSKGINEKENKKAIRSAIAASLNKDFVKLRGHIIPETYPFIVEDKIESLAKTKDVQRVLSSLGFDNEIERIRYRKIKPGKGALRGRKYKIKKGPLFVVGENCKLMKASSNIPGVEVVIVKDLNCKILAPGMTPGRLALFSESAIKSMKEKKLFI